MKKILITYIGNSDCHLEEGKEGPILDILKERGFEALHIFYDNDRYLIHASKILLYCQKKYPGMKVRYQKTPAINPTDYNLVYPAMVGAVQKVLGEEGTEGVAYTVSVTSGTPVMHACWILIVMGGVLKADLIQSSREEGVRDINFSLDDFPQITGVRQSKVRLTRAERENKLLRKQLMEGFEDLVGADDSIIAVKKQIAAFAGYDLPVFIHGESGTGKEVVAGLLHYHSSRKNAQFISVNCGTISDTLFNSEFFGHKKGSFTGAVGDHEGFFSQADKGTLFLDEIGDLTPQNQVKFLRVLDRMVIQPVGGREKKVDVRIIAASNKDLELLKNQGSFREDLFYRLVQLEIRLPPLRDRGADIILLTRHFLRKTAEAYGKNKKLTPAAEKKLLRYSFPGNVRELQKIISLAYIQSSDGIISEEDIVLPNPVQASTRVEIPAGGVDLLGDVLPAYYRAALEKTGGNASKAARLLGMKPHTFRARVKALQNKQ